MNLRTKTLTITWAALLVVLVGLYFGVRSAIMGRFARLENAATQANVDRMKQALQRELDAVAWLAGRQATWDRLSVSSGDTRPLLEDLGLGFALAVDAQGRLLWHREAVAGADQPGASTWEAFLRGHPRAWRIRKPPAPFTGLTRVGKAAYLLASHVRPEGDAMLVLGRQLGGPVVEHLNRTLCLRVDLWGWDDAGLPDDFRSARESLSIDAAAAIVPLSDKTMAGYLCVPDMDGAPAEILRVTNPRDIRAHVQTTLREMVFAFVITGLVLAATTWLLLERLVLSRVSRLRREVTHISDHASLSGRVSVPRDVEFATLSRAVNHMLQALERSQQNLSESEDRLRAILDATQAGIVITDTHGGRIVDANPAALAMMGVERVHVIGKPWGTFEDAAERDGAAPADGKEAGQTRLRATGGSDLDVLKTSRPIRLSGQEHVLHSFVDITDLRRAQAELRDSEERFRSISTAANDAIIMVDASGTVAYWNEAAERIFGYTSGEAVGQDVHTMLAPEATRPAAQEGISGFAATGAGWVIDQTREMEAVRKSGEVFPIELSVSAAKVRGEWHAIGMVRDITERKQAEAELARAREREAEVGWRIQETLLMGRPPTDVRGIAIAARTQPSQSIDGDFYDFIKHSDTCVDVIVGDVMGKGVPAALLGAATKALFLRAFSLLAAAGDGRPEPHQIVQAAHDAMVQDLIGLNSFVTVCYMRFDLEFQQVTVVDCGHTKTIHLHAADARYDELETHNVPLGFLADEEYVSLSVGLESGDVLFAYSDGFTEAKSASGDMFGAGRLIECVRAHAGEAPSAIIDAAVRQVVEFSGADTFADDLTCVAVKIGGHA